MTRTDNIGKIHSIMHRLAAFKATEQTRLGPALSDVARMTKARGIVVVISDLFDDEVAFEKGIQQLRFGGSEVIVFHVMDPYELEFPFDGTVEFIGLEGANRLKTNPQAIRKSYLDSVNEFRKRMQLVCDRSGCHYNALQHQDAARRNAQQLPRLPPQGRGAVEQLSLDNDYNDLQDWNEEAPSQVSPSF